MLTFRKAQEFAALWQRSEAILKAVPDQIAREVEIAMGQIQGAGAEVIARVHLAGGPADAEDALTSDQHLAIVAAAHGAIATIVSVAAQLSHLGSALDQHALLATVVGPVVAQLLDLRPAQYRQAFVALTGAFLRGMIEVEAARVAQAKPESA